MTTTDHTSAAMNAETARLNAIADAADNAAEARACVECGRSYDERTRDARRWLALDAWADRPTTLMCPKCVLRVGEVSKTPDLPGITPVVGGLVVRRWQGHCSPKALR